MTSRIAQIGYKLVHTWRGGKPWSLRRRGRRDSVETTYAVSRQREPHPDTESRPRSAGWPSTADRATPYALTLAWRLTISTCGEAEFVLPVRPEPEPVTVAVTDNIQTLRGRMKCTSTDAQLSNARLTYWFLRDWASYKTMLSWVEGGTICFES